jgi:tetratricopeptide (TPR) repeat protein
VPAGPLRFVRALEIVPGNARVVHHAVLRIDRSGTVRRHDEADPGPGFDGMVFAGAQMPDGRFLGWTPGKAPDPGTDARAWRLPGGSDLVLQLHLRPTGKPETVRAKIGLHFASTPPTKAALSMELSTTAIDLPPGAKDVHARDQYTVPVDVAVTSVYPHAHYLGKSIAAWAELPDGSRKWLVKIDDWDFVWQDQYRFVRPLRLPRGSTIHMDWTFDNSADNPRNPFSPPRHVVYGSASTDEMAELILEIEPASLRDLPALDEDFRRKWLDVQRQHFERELTKRPDDPDTLANVGAMRQILDDPSGARAAYESALRVDPRHVQANLELGVVLMSQGQLDEALAHIRRAAASKPDDPRIELALGNVHRKRGEPDQAIAHYRRAIDIDDDAAEAHNNLGIVLESRGDLDGAAAAFRRATEIQPDTALFRRNLARVSGGAVPP